ncbi:Prp18-domain-containing protein [Anaeromyces robustus]|uniref:Pre-mRNA-splicing factor 18 n=1 Tax=Anaeromyces robustus TaxID=1754192 RepID=A0A1Y1X1V4_9FUNG|nr:Prp18-domain-containing protein [Anaeromyces robustus]|eukprot:ORX79753.1 Prp18-domain-containing protein [Anaeromyces robustus]
MDFLKSIIDEEISKKRKLIDEAKTDNKNKKKYIKRSEIENLEKKKYYENLEKEKYDKEKKNKKNKDSDKYYSSNLSSNKVDELNNDDFKSKNNYEDDDNDNLSKIFENISQDEVIKRLRSHGEPIRYFGETDQERIIRLRHLEAAEEKTEGQRNEFMHALEDTDRNLDLETLRKQAGLDNEDDKNKKKKDYSDVDTSSISLELIQKDIDRAYFLLYVYFKRLLDAWEDDLNQRSEEVKRSYKGKRETAIQRQTRDYLKPFFKELKRKTLQADVLARVSEIAQFMQEREYMKANESYLQLSIGNAPWPIGVTMVGIHERSAREKIFASQVAHVLNDESQRKWIQSIKRIMTWAQDKYKPSDYAKRVG